MAKITGIGGVFVKSQNRVAREAWYAAHLGLKGEYGANLKYRDDSEEAFAVISTFAGDTDYMEPSTVPVMINFRVDDLDAFQKKLEAEGVEILGRQDESYGKFAWIMDPDGIKIELWEQIGPAPD
ncbi:VOC family protein [Pacificimonas sp. WHA3]|uniref:VOC family protein n=1 Tax=Pacificimonas pallii TaxID=2827236 RepID=A0ABS6SG51_9SPHN|nr:VOC family protein [Pacificimonas pallii]MBV7257235.1 VOC family protein [Pacificimonas pallii]